MNTIVLAADFAYHEHVITTIKSICYHNKNIQFYLFNRDYPSSWFDDINQQLQPLGSSIIDIKIDNEEIKSYETYEHISSDSTFYRYFIPTFVPENKVLYLDSDLVVTQDLTPLFQVGLSNCFAAGVVDKIANHFHQEHVFNAGVLLINNQQWKEQQISQKAIAYTNDNQGQLRDADQTVLNHLFKDSWIELDETYNYQTGYYFFNKKARKGFLGQLKEFFVPKKPVIIHYNSEAKPWNKARVKYANLYWFYRRLTWEQIQKRH